MVHQPYRDEFYAIKVKNINTCGASYVLQQVLHSLVHILHQVARSVHPMRQRR
jgi:hypothetical protein